MKSIQFLILVFILSACSYQVSRFPAQEEESVLDQIMTIAAGNSLDGDEEQYRKYAEAQTNMSRVKTEFIEDLNRSADTPFKLELVINPKNHQYVRKVSFSPDAFKDKEAVMTLINFIQNLERYNTLRTTAMHEMYYNAKLGHLPSLSKFLNLKLRADNKFAEDQDYFLTDEYKKRVESSAGLNNSIQADLKKLRATQKAAGLTRKQLEATLDKLPDDQQLKTLIAKNDRKGATDLIKKYLPWELMGPFEKKYWENYLDIMENPAPLQERVLIYRGVDDDVVHAGFKNGVALTKDQAIAEGKVFFMSTVMVKNQGSWNRRLRSLETMYEKEIGAIGNDPELGESIRISSLFNNHASEPKGSPFLSFTPDINVGMQFGSRKMSSYLVDPRLLTYNYMGLGEEAEFLMNLATFPDEMVGYLDYTTSHTTKEADKILVGKFLSKELVKKIEAEYGTVESDIILKKIQKNSYNFFLNKYKPVMEEAFLPDVHPGESNLKFYNSLKKEAPKPLLGPTGNLNCSDIIPMFWKH